MWKDRIGSGHIQSGKTEYGNSSALRFSRMPSRIICCHTVPYLRLKREKALTAIRQRGSINLSLYDTKEDRSFDVFYPYLAGLIDAEGTMGIYGSKSGKNNVVYATPKMQIPQLDKDFLSGLREEIGFGSVVKRGLSGSGKQMWCLGFGSKRAVEVARKIRPFLILKADDADALLSHTAKVRVDSATERSEAQEAKLLYESGMSATDVAKQLGRKPATVNYWLRQMGATRTLEQAQKLRRSKE